MGLFFLVLSVKLEVAGALGVLPDEVVGYGRVT
jgi:hypothetical protein